MTTTAIIVQARYSSSRYPGKVLETIAGRSILGHVLNRCAATKNADVVCCAIPGSAEDDILVPEIERTGCVLFRGEKQDVLKRYLDAARVICADIIVRVTSDCPLIDPQVIGDMISLFLDTNADFVCNNIPVVWPHGLDCEVFSIDLLERADTAEVRTSEREHVTGWMRLSPDVKRRSHGGPGGAAARQRWTVDYPADAEFINAVYKKLPANITMPLFGDISDVIDRYPQLLKINDMYCEDNRNPDQLPEHDQRRMYAVDTKMP